MPNAGAPPLSGDSEDQDDRRIRQVVAVYLRSHPPILGLDRDDLIQEGRLAWLEAMDTYRPDRGASRATYLGHVVTNHLRSLARLGRAQKRGAGQRTLSLDVPVVEDGDAFADLLPAAEPLPEELAERAELLAHLDRVRGRLHEREFRILEALAEGRPRTRIARDLGIHRSTLYADIERIQKVARDEGLQEFLQ